jgi:uncharacterized repeat protein (TIGR03803 family)
MTTNHLTLSTRLIVMNWLSAHPVRHFLHVIALCICGALPFVADAQAETLHNNLPYCLLHPDACGPGNAVPPGVRIAGYSSLLPSRPYLSPFVLRQDSFIDHIEFWSANASGPATIYLWDAASAGLQPPFDLNSPLMSFTASADYQFFGVDPNDPHRTAYYLASVELPTPFLATSGTVYYVSIEASFGWLLGFGGATGGASAWVPNASGQFQPALTGGAFRLSGTPASAVFFDVLHAFRIGAGANPYAALIQATDGNFYGTTLNGGSFGLGTVFKMTRTGTVSVLHVFAGGTDGAHPYAGLVQANDGNFYGTTRSGGVFDAGTVFRMTPDDQVTIFHSFAGMDGSSPTAALIEAADGNLYGTTFEGGAFNAGTVFQITLDGAFNVIHEFAFADGAFPAAALIQANDGNFYGTTVGPDDGTIFQLTPDGTVTVLHSFSGGSDGANPQASLIQTSDGTFYGTTQSGGASGGGTVFQMAPDGTVTVLHAFIDAEGTEPVAALLQGADGNFYGTTSFGGSTSDGPGTAFQMTPDGAVTVLHAFTGGTDGSCPTVALIQADDGSFYGTTSQGGISRLGLVFRLTVP